MNNLKSILITRKIRGVEDYARKLSARKIDIIGFPAIKILPSEDYGALDEAIENIADYSAIVFSSVNAAFHFMDRVENLNKIIDYRRLLIAATGEKTAEFLHKRGMKVNIVPEVYTGEGLFRKLSEQELEGKKILIPSSSISRDRLPKLLREAGAEVNVVEAYRTVTTPPKELASEIKQVKDNKPGIFLFTSPSNFSGFVELLGIKDVGEYFSGVLVTAIGSTTKAAIKRKGIEVDLVPETFTVKSAVEKILESNLSVLETN